MLRQIASKKDAYPKLVREFYDQKRLYSEEKSRLSKMFVADLEEEFGTSILPEPVRDALYIHAYRDAHHNGLHEVVGEYKTLSTLALMVFEAGKSAVSEISPSKA